MFTGIIEAVGAVCEVTEAAGGNRLGIASPLSAEIAPGDSLAVNGVCLTVTGAARGVVFADIGPETLRVTTLGALREGQKVNLERPLRVNATLGGHLVQGHVDGVATIDELRPDGESHWMRVRFPAALSPFFIPKGSVAVDGISLTIARLGRSHFDVQIIPFTWEHTALHAARTGDGVNIECDMIGKYVVRAIESTGRARADAPAEVESRE